MPTLVIRRLAGWSFMSLRGQVDVKPVVCLQAQTLNRLKHQEEKKKKFEIILPEPDLKPESLTFQASVNYYAIYVHAQEINCYF